LHLHEHIYSLESINELPKSYPEYQDLVTFMSSWIRGDSSFVFHSSGSTGEAKEIFVSNKQIQSSIEATRNKLELQKEDCVLLCLNPDFIASKMMVARALSIGMDLVIVPPTSSPLKLIQTNISFASFVPFQIYKMIHDGSISKLSLIKNVLIGGAPLDSWAIDVLSKFVNNIYLTYGMTETVSHIALKKITGQDASGLFSVMDNIDIKVDNRSCLCIKGTVTNDELIITNDVVELKTSGTFDWLGRYDNIINSGGVKINPEKIERLIALIIPNKNFFVSGIADRELGEKCTLIIEGDLYTESGKLKRKATLELITK